MGSNSSVDIGFNCMVYFSLSLTLRCGTAAYLRHHERPGEPEHGQPPG